MFGDSNKEEKYFLDRIAMILDKPSYQIIQFTFHRNHHQVRSFNYYFGPCIRDAIVEGIKDSDETNNK